MKILAKRIVFSKTINSSKEKNQLAFLKTHFFIVKINVHDLTPMFIAALFTIAKLWKQPRCPTTDEWIKKLWCLYIMEFY
jgi:hypothetical protein